MADNPITPADLNRAKALPLLCALDDHDFPDRERALAKWFVRLTYLQGIDSLVLGSRTHLADLAGIGKNHFALILRELIGKNVILVHEGSGVCRVRTDVHNWKVPALCQAGHDHARRLASKLVRMHYDAIHQIDMAEIDASFARWLTLNDGLALHSQEEGAQLHWPFDLRPPGPGAAGGVVHPNPPGSIQDAAAAGPNLDDPRWVREQVRRSLESVGTLPAEEVPETGTNHDLRTAPPLVPVPETGTGSGQEGIGDGPESPKRGPSLKTMFAESLKRGQPVPETGTFGPQKGDSSRARPSDDHLSSDHLPNPVQRTSSSDQKGDDRRGDERGGAEKWQMVGMDDELFGDLRRELDANMGSFTVDWRRAIFHARLCVYEALAALKLNRGAVRKHAGGYLRRCFLNECHDRGVVLPPDLFPHRKERRQ